MRLYPTAEQAAALRQWIGCCRYVWNWTVATQAAARKDTGKKLSPGAVSRALTDLRKDPARPWLAQVPRAPLEQVLRNNEKTWVRYFTWSPGTGDRRPGMPRFHSRTGHDRDGTGNRGVGVRDQSLVA